MVHALTTFVECIESMPMIEILGLSEYSIFLNIWSNIMLFDISYSLISVFNVY